MVRDSRGCVHLGKTKTVKRLFVRAGAGAERYAKSEPLQSNVACEYAHACTCTCHACRPVRMVTERLYHASGLLLYRYYLIRGRNQAIIKSLAEKCICKSIYVEDLT